MHVWQSLVLKRVTYHNAAKDVTRVWSCQDGKYLFWWQVNLGHQLDCAEETILGL